MDNSSKMSYTSLFFLGVVAITIGLGVVLDGICVYGLPFFTSISESATTPLKTSMLLPFGLGLMSLFFFNYRGYDRTDNILAKLMAIGFSVVAMQPCLSPYNQDFSAIGLFGVSPKMSNTLHNVGALMGFGAMWYWIMFQFTKGLMDEERTKMKRWRNRVYRGCGLAMLSGIAWFLIGEKVCLTAPNTWIAEELILIPAGIACLVKGGAFLKDYEEK